MEPENLQSVLQEAGIIAEMKNLQNPTEDFMIYLITEYLNKFFFDGNEISKSTPEQLRCISCPDSALDAIRVINIHSSLSTVCNEIFLKDLCLTDITSPGPKRARRQIKILFNFFAYVRNKMVENEMAFVELDNQQKYLETMIDNKNTIIAKIGATLCNLEKKLGIKHQLQQEIKKINLKINENNKKFKELEYQVKEVMIHHQDGYKQCNDLKSNAVKLHKLTMELQSKIVKSPEEYRARTRELKKILEMKIEERQVLNDSITRKKLQIKNNECAQELVKDFKEKFLNEIKESSKKLKKTIVKLKYAHRQLDLLNKDITKWKNIEASNTNNIALNKDEKGHEQLLFELNNQYTNLKREFHLQSNLIKKIETTYIKKKRILENESNIILIIQKNNVDIMKKYIEFLQNEISQELSLRQEIVNTLLKVDKLNVKS